MELTPTGIEALDLFLKGGLPPGFTTVVLAPPGSGVELFAKQFACAAPDARTAYVSTDEGAREVEAAARAAGWQMGHVAVIDLQSEFAEHMMAEQQRALERRPERPPRFSPRDLVERSSSRDLLQRARPAAARHAADLTRLLEPFSTLRPPDRTVVNSLDFFLNLHPLEQVVSALMALKAANARVGGQMMWVLSKDAFGPTVERRLELLADCLIELEVTRKGTVFERFFLVKKVKNRASGAGVSTYDITPQGFHLETLERIV